MKYDVLIIGAGHAGVEAAFAAQKIVSKVAIVTINKNDLSSLPCNVSIGGSAKGILVREISALGGIMPKAADETQLQTKILNLSKGPAVHSLRAQIDKIEYPKKIKSLIENTDIVVIEDIVKYLHFEKNMLCGVVTEKNKIIYAKKVIIATGTFMDSKIMRGSEYKKEGPDNKQTSSTLSLQLKELGFSISRFKTGTPPRIYKDSIDYSEVEIDKGNQSKIYFSRFFKINKKFENENAWLTHTNEETHKIVKNHINESYLYSKEINGIGPRYCPSIEDKIKRFSNKKQHHLFLELESKKMDTIYLSGLSTSLPSYVQDKMIKTIPGFKNAKIKKYAYAIEYDIINSIQLLHTLESKIIKNLYFAGQINGTSGYEEAAAQGLVAGVNASNSILKKEPFILRRDNSYIGLMIDDITTKELYEPYRVLTSRAEYRLYLRDDNAEDRLFNISYKNNLIDRQEYENYFEKNTLKKTIIKKLKEEFVDLQNEDVKKYLIDKGEKLKNKHSYFKLLQRPNIKLQEILKLRINNLSYDVLDLDLRTIEVAAKFEGYINKQNREIKKYLELNNIKIKPNIDYNKLENLSIEGKEKLLKHKPETIFQAKNIQGIDPSDIMVLIQYMNRRKK